MKKYCRVLLVALVTGIYVLPAQTISSQKGLTTAVFNLPAGTIKIYLPDDIRAGDKITGKITTAPLGNNSKQTAKNLALLKRYTVEFNGQKYPVANAVLQGNILNSNTGEVTLNILNNNAVAEGQIKVNVGAINNQQSATEDCKVPTHALCGSPLQITGPFDGDASNTKCSIGNNFLEILAESPRQCIVQYPEEGAGVRTLNVQENVRPNCSKNVKGVIMNIAAGNLNLLKGEKTYIDVEIKGLQNLTQPALLTLRNVTLDIVSMLPSNDISISLIADSSSNDRYIRRFDIHSLQSGNFAVDINLDLPDNPPPVFADVRKPAGGKHDEKVLTAGTRTALELAMKKWTQAQTEGDYPPDYECTNCIQCIKAYATEKNAADVGELGWGIITSFLSGGVKMAGGLLEKVKDIADKGGDIYKAIKELIDQGKIQVIGFKEKWCDNNANCQVTGIIVYDVATGCAEAEFRCRGNKLCCNIGETTYKMKYCFDEDGAVIDNTISITIKH